ncbi:RNA polymerase sigma-70 factor [Natronoflexus pectinivorans]|uniref:RNA polymerase sigma-70 factor (ECF subfamily) n=1 Tax=Natronoflexus pectinivorans TaxID=682526 RepID=A0A4R2GIZ6_9BACT|nr:RNA polymerase sigma-70 factor [Natronoflexus pectinivorans]TCO07297.1 RNA polymerase sigma-70 factor (ECF subfamily) [Natronoflexus pectinivorans]
MSTNGQTKEETFLLNGLMRGEESFYRRLFDLYYKQLVIFANRILNDDDQSRNVVQDVFVMIFDKRSELNIHTSLKAHLYQTVKNRCLNIVKRDKIIHEHHQNILSRSNHFIEPSENLEYTELEEKINNTISSLPDQCQRIFKMSRFEGHSNQDIADQLDISKRTVETQISKALKKLREELMKSQMLPPILAVLFCLLQPSLMLI